ncbi:MAG: hypothetical protein Q7U60_01000 [Candidatus Methanoperedens sp.]|nr:hypothetical protein [Candidatus Methanoperedens sp.]
MEVIDIPEKLDEKDPYLGCQPLLNYYLTENVGEGKIGIVYKAIRSDLSDTLACKVIPDGKLKDGWQRELEKNVLLRGVPYIVPYHSHGTSHDNNHRPFTYVFFDFIQGRNLKQYLESPPWPLDMAFIESIVKTILQVLHACHAVGIQHGDLHEGNILIKDPDSRLPGSPRTIWISDFGYGGSHNKLDPKDDFRQLFSITSNLLRKLDRANLNPRDRVMHQKVENFLKKKILELDATQGHHVRNPESLLMEFNKLNGEAENESAAAVMGITIKRPSDFLWAEALGYRVDEWKNLFVPEFLAAEDLLSMNITVLTGARGCGKTMAFRRLTLLMDKVIGEPSGVKGADQFIGFYLNCRDLIEAFPWLPGDINEGVQQQLIHYFHLAWFSEICKTLAIYDPNQSEGYKWLDGFLVGIFPNKYQPLPQGADVLTHVRAFIETEKERCRCAPLGKEKGLTNWPLARTDFLDLIQSLIESHLPVIGSKPLYFFLDDYTMPIIPDRVQRFLNLIIFKRRNMIFFKISTESSNSLKMVGVRGKPLEIHHDFELIDLATECIHQDEKEKAILLDKIFRPRIERHQNLFGKNLSLENLLGKMKKSNNELAMEMRNAVQAGKDTNILYYGANSFEGMWTSDIRSMIQMFTDMLREANGGLKEGKIIPEKIQDRIYRAAGGEFLIFTELAKNPFFLENSSSSKKSGEPYGRHLKEIVDAFKDISRFELTTGPLVSNQGRQNPKQAFRLEIIDKFDLPNEVLQYYEGLVRWHIFLQDWRGKSVRGMMTPRLYLNRILIPYCKLTFSTHDNIQLTNMEFVELLKEPKKFLEYWKNKKRNSKKRRRNRTYVNVPPLSTYDYDLNTKGG